MGVVLEWVEAGRAFPLPLGPPVVIGRGVRADIVLPERSISRRHCVARWDGCCVWVHDLGSTYGTWLNSDRFHDGTPVGGAQGSLLRLGEVLYLGGARLRLGTPSRGGALGAMARHAKGTGGRGGLPVLADALEEAGCTDGDLLAHLRSGGCHLRGCWAVDLLLGKS
jgi:hypothetical protein